MVTVVPQSKEEWLSLRQENINSTEVSALFGCSPYQTLYELWHIKKGNLKDSFVDNERVKWGTRLQDSIAMGIAEDNAWPIRRMDEYIYDQELRAGSSFDFSVQRNTALLEIKNVDSLAFKEGWLETDSGVESPLHIELQVQHQMMISGYETCYIGALVGGNRAVIIERKKDPLVIAEIKKKIKQFWISIYMNDEPKPDFEKDKDAIRELYKVAKKGKAVEGTMQVKELAEMYSNLTEQLAALNKKRDAIKMQMLTMMGDAEKIIGEGYQVSAGVIQRAGYEVKPVVYRDFRIRFMEK